MAGKSKVSRLLVAGAVGGPDVGEGAVVVACHAGVMPDDLVVPEEPGLGSPWTGRGAGSWPHQGLPDPLHGGPDDGWRHGVDEQAESTEPDTVVGVRLCECERGCDIQKGCYGDGCGPREECRPPGGDEMERSISPPWVRAVSVSSRECSGIRLGGCHGSSPGCHRSGRAQERACRERGLSVPESSGPSGIRGILQGSAEWMFVFTLIRSNW